MAHSRRLPGPSPRDWNLSPARRLPGPDPAGERPTLPALSLKQQLTRQRLSPRWEPEGFARYANSQALMHELDQHMVGFYGTADYGPGRFAPPSVDEDR